MITKEDIEAWNENSFMNRGKAIELFRKNFGDKATEYYKKMLDNTLSFLEFIELMKKGDLE